MNIISENLEFQVICKDKQLFSQLGSLNANNKKLETPSLWLGHVIGSKPRIWENMSVKNVMVNAYNILKKPSACESIKKIGIHNHLNFDGLIMMDSGGFLFQKKEEIDIDSEVILELYEDSKPDIGVVLDHPFDPINNDASNRKRWVKTLENTEKMINSSSKIPIMPVLHGYSIQELKNACIDIKKIDDDPKMIGLGSLVPLVFSTPAASKRFPDCMSFILESINLIRSEFPDAMIHAFGIGSTFTMHLMYAIGADSLDTTGWRIKAAYGIIQLPGVSDRHPKTRNNGRSFLKNGELDILKKCECPTCSGETLEQRLNKLDQDFYSRALHNAWVFKEEEYKFKNSLKKGETRKFVEKRLKNSYYSKSFDYLINTKETSPLSRWV